MNNINNLIAIRRCPLQIHYTHYINRTAKGLAEWGTDRVLDRTQIFIDSIVSIVWNFEFFMTNSRFRGSTPLIIRLRQWVHSQGIIVVIIEKLNDFDCSVWPRIDQHRKLLMRHPESRHSKINIHHFGVTRTLLDLLIFIELEKVHIMGSFFEIRLLDARKIGNP